MTLTVDWHELDLGQQRGRVRLVADDGTKYLVQIYRSGAEVIELPSEVVFERQQVERLLQAMIVARMSEDTIRYIEEALGVPKEDRWRYEPKENHKKPGHSGVYEPAGYKPS